MVVDDRMHTSIHPPPIGWFSYCAIESFGSIGVSLFWAFVNATIDLEGKLMYICYHPHPHPHTPKTHRRQEGVRAHSLTHPLTHTHTPI